MIVFSVRDSALGQYMNPFCAPSVGMASRSFIDEVNRSDSPLNQHPDDYELFQVGEFDVDTGVLKPLLHPMSVERAKDVVRSKV